MPRGPGRVLEREDRSGERLPRDAPRAVDGRDREARRRRCLSRRLPTRLPCSLRAQNVHEDRTGLPTAGALEFRSLWIANAYELLLPGSPRRSLVTQLSLPVLLAYRNCVALRSARNLTHLLSECKKSRPLNRKSFARPRPEGVRRLRGAPSAWNGGSDPELGRDAHPRALELGPVQVEQVGAGLAAGDRAEHEEELVRPRHARSGSSGSSTWWCRPWRPGCGSPRSRPVVGLS